MKSRGVLSVIAVAALASALVAAGPVSISPTPLLDEVKALTAVEMEGRASGTPGGELAARHIAAALGQAGLEPAGANGYLTPFGIPGHVSPGSDSVLVWTGWDARTLTLGGDWTPAGGSADGEAEGEVAFVGYGISAPELGWDDYAGVDVRGKIVLALGGEPRRADPPSPFAGAYASGYGQRPHKARAARAHGARALLFVPRPGSGADALPPLRDSPGTDPLLGAAITRLAAEALLEAGGQRLDDLKTRIDTTLAPASRILPGLKARLRVRLLRETGLASNVVGILPGTDPVRAREAIVIGAHYDHLGRTGEGSLDAGHPTDVHPGADDNASGTAAVLALARAFGARGGTPRTLVFALFAGEELGFLGAEAYLRQPPWPLEQTVAMLNLDMIGRMRGERLHVGGLDSASGFESLVAGAADGLGLQIERRGSPDGPSDHLSFYRRRVPVLFFHTGVHADYHRPTDTWDKINADGLARVVAMAERAVDRLARGPAPVYAEVPAERPQPAVGATSPGSGTGYFGVAPDATDDAPGVRLSMVEPGTAAARAGMRPGDVVVRFGGVRVYTFEDLRDSITAGKPGDEVDVVYLRDGRERAAVAVLGGRP